MREQYHFRKIDGKTHIWDINKLLSTLNNHPITQIPLNTIQELNENYWFSDHATITTQDIIEHMKLVNETDLSFPILMCPDYLIMDGMHRVAKAVLDNREYINAYVLSIMPQADYLDVDPDLLPYDD